MKDKPRIGTWEWIRERPEAVAIFNGNYDDHGDLLPENERPKLPWTTVAPSGDWEYHATQPAAMRYASWLTRNDHHRKKAS